MSNGRLTLKTVAGQLPKSPRSSLPRYRKHMIRLDLETDDKFETLSRRQRVSVNSLYDKALRRYVDWEVFSEGIGMIPISPLLWKYLMNRLTDEEARELGRSSGGDVSIEFITSYFHKFDIDTLLESFRLLGDQYMHAFRYADFGNDTSRTVILYHKSGQRVSAYYSEVLKALCQRLQVGVKIKESEDQIIATMINHNSKSH